MSDLVTIELCPLGKSLSVERGTPLRDILFAFGVEFPCGGRGRCRACRVRVLEGTPPASDEQAAILSPDELADGWRLACRSRASSDLKLEISQWESPVLSDDSVIHFHPGHGLGIAVDLGTTTLVAQLVDRGAGKVIAVQTALNPQAAHGSDVMSRVQFALDDSGLARLRTMIREGIGEILDRLIAAAGKEREAIEEVAIVGNTVMHHLFCGIDVRPLAYFPFEPAETGTRVFRCADLGWNVPGEPLVRFLPCVGGFVGSDILAGILATRIYQSDELAGLIDLGTNGEVVFGNSESIVCASTAAGPAFEGARISMGMRAATGAIAEVQDTPGGVGCRVLGGGAPRGICGSGLVDAVAVGLERGYIKSNGRFSAGWREWVLCPPVSLCQNDISELQLAKGAIAAAARLLLRRLGASPGDVARLYLAGAFGNYVDRGSARRIGLIEFDEDRVQPAGNTALQGAKLALFGSDPEGGQFDSLRKRIEHVPLSSNPDFQDTFVECIGFPSS